ncbi:hypothetical protein D3C76_1389540 [compost metagenome]
MKKLIILLSSIIIISNSIWSYVFFKGINKPSDIAIQVYNLNGTGEMWDVINYQIIVSPSKILRGHGGLVFKGDPKDIENSTYYEYEFKEINSSGNYDTVYSIIASSKDGPVSILNNLNIGSITGEHNYDELKKDKQNYENTTLTITWNDNKGELHSETVNLDIASEITLNDY